MEAMQEGARHIQWRMQMQSCQHMIDSIEGLVTLQPDDWKKGMVRYWEKNLVELSKKEPEFSE